MKTRNKKYFFFPLITLITLTIILTYPTTETNKVIIDGKEYLTPNTEISIKLEYEHSVELTKITEEYEIKNCEITLTTFTWPGYGAGLPSRPEDTPSQTKDESGNYVARNITLNTTTLKISMKHRVNPKLTINNKEVESKEEVVVITCVRTPLIEILTSRKLPQANNNT